jgi:hypothetical protein
LGIIYCLILASDIPFSANAEHWWVAPVRFGDWRGIPPHDFVTNVPVHRWYSGAEAGSYRPELPRVFYERIVNGDTVSVATDYYGMNISRTLVPDGIADYYGQYLWNGGVVMMEACGQDSTISFWIKQ